MASTLTHQPPPPLPNMPEIPLPKTHSSPSNRSPNYHVIQSSPYQNLHTSPSLGTLHKNPSSLCLLLSSVNNDSQGPNYSTPSLPSNHSISTFYPMPKLYLLPLGPENYPPFPLEHGHLYKLNQEILSKGGADRFPTQSCRMFAHPQF